jgi:glycosyltransferase involved in cell wall biosynthesis
MSVFKRGIESEVFLPQIDAKNDLETLYHIPKHHVTLLYAGRISMEKQVETVLHVYEQVVSKHPNVSLVFAGNGPEPYFREFKRKASAYQNIYFLGRLKRTRLPLVYSGADLFLFPSTTDTFGMVVLEAQACGLPALVADVGGPKEIIVDGTTGFALPAMDVAAWSARISAMITMMYGYPEQYLEMRHAAREHVLSVYDWQNVLNDLFDIKERIDYRTGLQYPDREKKSAAMDVVTEEG